MKTHIFLSVFASLLFLQNVNAAVYTCTANGKTVYQGKPCAASGKTVGDRARENREAEKYSSAHNYSSSAPVKSGGKYSEQEWSGICRAASKTARAVMRNRQLGISMNDQMDKLLPSAEPAIKNTIESMIRLAYTKPRFSTPAYMQSAETDFEDEYQLLCLRAKS
ncbi:MAG: hypothetical protein VB979_00105 [Acinetobacter sp.]|uniref:hypothetical protein n=1 Tax=Acinetobacter sp. TaxID=472 RepID=UPI003981D84E